MLPRRRLLPKEGNSCNALQQCPGAMGTRTHVMHCLTAWGQRTVQFLQYTATLLGGSGECNSYNTLPHCLAAVGSGAPATHCLTAWGHWVVQILQRTASLPGGSGQCKSCSALAHRLEAVGIGTPAMRCPTISGEGESCPGGRRCLWGACGGRQPPSAQTHNLGGRGVVPRRRSLPMVRLLGMAAPSGLGPLARGTGKPAQAAVGADGAPVGEGSPSGPVPPAGGTGSPAQAAVGAYGAPLGDSSPHRHGLTSWGEGEPCPGGGGCLGNACGGRQPPLARAHHLGGREVRPRRRSLPMEHLRGTAAPSGAGPPARRTESPTKAVVIAYGALARDGTPQRRGPASWGDGESCPGGGGCRWSAYRGRQPPSARAHGLGGQRVLPRRWSLPMECLLGTVAPSGPDPPTGGTGSPAQAAVGAYGAPVGDGSPQRPKPTSWGDGEWCPGGGRCLWSACG